MSQMPMLIIPRARRVAQCGALILSSMLGFAAAADTPAQSPSKARAAAPVTQGTKLAPAKSRQARQQVVSPYARAAAERAHAGKSPALGQTTLQAVQNSHKTHGTPPK